MKDFKIFISESNMSELDIKLDEYNKTLKEKFAINLDKYKDELEGGMADNITVEEILSVPLEYLIKGIETEFEHTNRPYKALAIALDHFFENPPESFKYYIGLDAVEKVL